MLEIEPPASHSNSDSVSGESVIMPKYPRTGKRTQTPSYEFDELYGDDCLVEVGSVTMTVREWSASLHEHESCNASDEKRDGLSLCSNPVFEHLSNINMLSVDKVYIPHVRNVDSLMQ